MNTRVREQYNTLAAVAGGRSWSCDAWQRVSKTRAGVLAAVEDLRDEDSNCRRDRVLGRRGGASLARQLRSYSRKMHLIIKLVKQSKIKYCKPY